MTTAVARAYLAAADTFADLVERIDPATLRGPGLGDWDLRALVGHTSRALVTVVTYFDQPAVNEDIPSPEEYYVRIARVSIDPADIAERGRQAGAALGDDPVATVRNFVAQARAKVEGTPPDALITTIIGGMRAEAYLPTRTFELVVHMLDIAAATDLPVELPPEALAQASHLATEVCVASGQAPTLLAAMTGRTALPAGFSIVP
ncbi:MAG TPA: maleylpyruvate isomerase N-terminal domain-containing protein [Sporichthya sp.]|nr:maleylpyruvate isomerase N-terminal domain-containing protein [Sporichthya sp.]